jgi:hypothetical protein
MRARLMTETVSGYDLDAAIANGARHRSAKKSARDASLGWLIGVAELTFQPIGYPVDLRRALPVHLRWQWIA